MDKQQFMGATSLKHRILMIVYPVCELKHGVFGTSHQVMTVT
ncbi:MAG: hypothetical protein ACJAYN_002665 [Bermanella sp.]|jgi:hypothetical protein|nr:hypothetical protein [Glaciecola sp. 33A]